MPEVIVQRIKGGWIHITADYVMIQGEAGLDDEIVYWAESEWNTPGNAEAAQAALNAICLALTEGADAVRQ